MEGDDMKQVAELIGRALRHRHDEHVLSQVHGEVGELCDRFPPYPQLVGLRAASGSRGRTDVGSGIGIGGG
jgi:hypothetical protein